MFQRLLVPALQAAAARFPVVVVLGARQVGKTTLARSAFAGHRYVDLEDPRTAERYRLDPRFEIDAAAPPGLILDEAQAVPAVFAALRGAVDERRGDNGRFIVLVSAQPAKSAFVRGVSESLAGRAAVLVLDPLTAAEVALGHATASAEGAPRPRTAGARQPGADANPRAVPWRQLWLAGGFPDALRGDFRAWWDSYLRLVLERDLPQYGLRADPLFLRRLLTMLAHQHGGLLNASSLGSSLGVSHHTVLRHLDTLESVYLVRRLLPYFRNIGKRLTKAPKVYLRDSGLLHHLLNIATVEELHNHPSRGASWEGFVIEDVLRRERLAHAGTAAFFWRTAAGAEVDLVLERAGRGRIAIEIKAGRGDDARAVRTLREAMPDIDAERGWIIDQAAGSARVSERIARIGFDEVVHGVP